METVEEYVSQSRCTVSSHVKRACISHTQLQNGDSDVLLVSLSERIQSGKLEDTANVLLQGRYKVVSHRACTSALTVPCGD